MKQKQKMNKKKNIANKSNRPADKFYNLDEIDFKFLSEAEYAHSTTPKTEKSNVHSADIKSKKPNNENSIGKSKAEEINNYIAKKQSSKISKNSSQGSKVIRTTNERLSDLHIHSNFSTDGKYSIDSIVNYAKKHKMEWLSVTDHNYIMHVLEYLTRKGMNLKDAYHFLGEDLKFVPGAEITCRLYDANVYGMSKRKHTVPPKFHLLIYSPVLKRDSDIVKVLDLKRKNDISFDFGAMLAIAEEKKIEINEEDVLEFEEKQRDENPGYNAISGSRDIWDFFKTYYPETFKNKKELEILYEDVKNQTLRLNLDIKDMIDLVHKEGGLALIAHPTINSFGLSDVKKTYEILVDMGIDGIEEFYPSKRNYYHELFDDIAKRVNVKNEIIKSAGSDFHRINGWRLPGEFAKGEGGKERKYITHESISTFERAERLLQDARKNGALTNRTYNVPTDDKVNELINRYESFVNSNSYKGEYKIFCDPTSENKHYDQDIDRIK